MEVPNILQQTPVTYYAQMRPYREGGNLLKKEIVKTKTVIHNYGHGGAGVSLAPASAIEAIKLSHG